MSPIDPPHLHGSPLGTAVLKAQPEDFQVEEILGFEPSGDGEHCFLWVEKTDVNSNNAAAHFAECLGIRKRLISHCGLKDKRAVTRQWFSIHLPGQPSPAASTLESESIRILRIERNTRKLRRGSHDGNRFTLRLHDCQFLPFEADQRWEQIVSRGVPNYFGPQRFGRDGSNVDFARRLFNGQAEVRDRALRGILISAVRSYLFNAVLAERVTLKNWDTVLAGEVFGFPDNRSLILPDNQRGDEADRFQNGSVELTAPLWGEGDLHSLTDVRTLETSVAARHPGLTSGLEHFGLRQERRVTRLRPTNSTLHWECDTTLRLTFDLPKGAYATTILRELADTI